MGFLIVNVDASLIEANFGGLNVVAGNEPRALVAILCSKIPSD